MTVIKRDGRPVPYDSNKIQTAINLALGTKKSVSTDSAKIVSEIYNAVCTEIDIILDVKDNITVEEIQDIIVTKMNELGYTKIAKDFTAYRKKRTKIRDMKSSLMNSIRDMTEQDAKDNDTKRENANIDGDTAMGTMLKCGTTTYKEYYLNNVIPYHISEHHIDGDIHIHDLDFYSLTTTCNQIDIGKLLDRGFSTGHGYLRSPNGIISAAALTCICIQSNQNDQHGGQSVPMFDYALAPYVAKTYISNICKYLDMNDIDSSVIKNIEDDLREYQEINTSILEDVEIVNIINKYINNITMSEKCVAKSRINTDKDTHQAMEALIGNLNTMQARAGAQVPFSSVNFGTDTTPEGRMVIKNLLLAQDEGLGNGETSIFPITIFKVKEGINYNEGDTNYDLFKLACKVSAKRLFPNFSFIDAPYNLAYYKEGIPDTEIAYMGCVSGDSKVTYKFNNELYVESIGAMFNRLSDSYETLNYGLSGYYDTSDGRVLIYDSKNGFVRCKKVIRNPNMNNWVHITFSNGKTLDCTSDHPLPIVHGDTTVRTYVKDIKVGDMVIATNHLNMCESAYTENCVNITITAIEHIESANSEYLSCSYDVETESDMFDVAGIRSHNCRTRVMSDINDVENEEVTGRGNLSFTSINLPRLAIESKGDIKLFYEKLDDMMDVVTEQLLHRFELQYHKTIKNYPFLMGQGVWKNSDKLGIEDNLYEALKHGTLSIGFIGLAETLIALTGKHHGESEESQKLGLEIISHMREYTDKQTEKHHLNFSLLATPAEGLSSRFVKIDKKKYGIIEGVTDKDYYTNSFHIPVYYPISAYKKLQLEAPYHAFTNAGHISYVELDGDPLQNLEAFESIIRCMKESGIGYGSINHPVDYDPVCGYTGIIGDVCPCCGRKNGEPVTAEVYREVIAKKRHMRRSIYGNEE